MRFPRIIAMLVLALMFAAVAEAQDSAAKTGLTFSVGASGADIAVRRLIGPQWAALGTFGYTKGTLYAVMPAGNSQDVTLWSLTASARRYMSPDPLRPFLEAGAGLRSTSDVPGCDDIHSPYGTAGGGVEYKVAPRVSIEGSAGVAYTSASQRCTANGVEYKFDSHTWSTFRTALSITFYF